MAIAIMIVERALGNGDAVCYTSHVAWLTVQILCCVVGGRLSG